ncbi:MAG: hypothetical protein KDD56_07270 [Bdellovibrionales bacterium]|nr:hypothetical protein [Bdellovibrionales bacterium]
MNNRIPEATIFFDLETSDSIFMGQILNYCFIAVDADFNIIEESYGDVLLSPLQIPTPEAILTNRIDVMNHQKNSTQNEIDAVKNIYDFISRILKETSGIVPLIGYNSSRFDIPFLRTTLIRNGVNPYFNKELVYRDLLHGVRKLSTTEKNFPRAAYSKEEPDKLSLKLETVCRELDLITGVQTHNSRDDVIITIDLAKKLIELFNFDIRIYESYEAEAFHRDRAKHPLIYSLKPNYELNADSISVSTPLCLLDANHRSSLWINLDNFEETNDKSSISWFGVNSSQLVVSSENTFSNEIMKLRDIALVKLSSVNLNNYFTISNCDIEQDIYRLDFNDIKSLSEAIWNNDTRKLNASLNKNSKILYSRYKLSNFDIESKKNKQGIEILKKYAKYRYGGSAKIDKFDTSDECKRHRELSDYISSIKRLSAEGSREDKELLKSLLSYIKDSAIVRHAGDELGLDI